MDSFKVDLTNCDREPIHILGKVQTHGFLIAADTQTGSITYISENLPAYIKEEAKNFLGTNIIEAEKKLQLSNSQLTLSQRLTVNNSSKGFEINNPYYIELNKEPYNLIISISGNNHVYEFEPSSFDEVDIQKVIGRSVSQILSKTSITSLLSEAASEIKNIIDYDRVMIYKFDEEGHGQVIAEQKNDNLEPFLGLYYPASDIPKQARELYKINLTRIVADVDSESAAIITHLQNEPLDLTHSVLRAVSPIHIQYLKNMGVKASFSISLITKGELWGLIACHNYVPKFINFKVRDASKLIGQILSSALEYRQGEEDVAEFNLLSEAATNLNNSIESENFLTDALTRNAINIQNITTAKGVALLFDNKITCIGNTPTEKQIVEMAKWIIDNTQDTIYYTHRFPEVFLPAQAYSNVASGVIVCVVSKNLSEMIIWFKPEQITNINWAGNPEKAVEISDDGMLQLLPRKSFKSWTEIVKNTSTKWNRAEITAVLQIKDRITYAINRKANEIRLLNERLVVAYEELNTFSFTVSHDLQTPLSSIKNYTELLLERNESLDDNARFILGRINTCADKMTLLIKEVLKYSIVGREEIKMVQIDMVNMMETIKLVVIDALQPQNLAFTIGNMPAIKGDEVMICQVFTNLINNAVKYSSKSIPSVVSVKGAVFGNEIIYSITDNGVGIDINYYTRVYELFKRMDNATEFEGTGVGLAIVKRIIEKHQARIWFESELGIGTTFYMAFKSL